MSDLYELDGTQSLGGEFDGLVEAPFASVRDVHHLDHVLDQTGVEQITPLLLLWVIQGKQAIQGTREIRHFLFRFFWARIGRFRNNHGI